MLKNGFFRSADDPTEATSRRRLLQMAVAVAVTAPLAAPTPAGAAQASPERPTTAAPRIRSAVLVPRFGGDTTADWYSSALAQLAGLGIRAAIAKAVGDNPHEIAQTILIGHSVGSRALLAYLSRHGADRTFAGLVSVAGWFTADDLISYPALAPWVNMEVNFGSIASAAGPITVHLSDNDPFTADWQANAADWLGKLGAAVHIAHGAGYYMAANPGPVLYTIRVASLANT
jgi:predicted alpha/beta hydrolase family esterase